MHRTGGSSRAPSPRRWPAAATSRRSAQETRRPRGRAATGRGAAAAPVDDSPAVEEAAAQTAAEDLLDADALDDLVAPIALYPGRADRADPRRRDLPARHRQGRPVHRREQGPAGQGARRQGGSRRTGTRASRTLAGGFPSVIGRMADDLDWTEKLGDAVLAQTDDVLDAVQRMRSRAVAAGTLTSNEAQVVEDRGRQRHDRAGRPERRLRAELRRETAYTAPRRGHGR